jgi:hypothetical protein
VAPVLDSLAATAAVVWFNQFPVIDYLVPGDVLAPKVDRYNAMARNAIHHQKINNSSGRRRVVFWDSGDALALDYIRACNEIKRHDIHPSRMDWLLAYYNCNDYIHTGYALLSQTTQILLNAICNN